MWLKARPYLHEVPREPPLWPVRHPHEPRAVLCSSDFWVHNAEHQHLLTDRERELTLARTGKGNIASACSPIVRVIGAWC